MIVLHFPNPQDAFEEEQARLEMRRIREDRERARELAAARERDWNRKVPPHKRTSGALLEWGR